MHLNLWSVGYFSYWFQTRFLDGRGKRIIIRLLPSFVRDSFRRGWGGVFPTYKTYHQNLPSQQSRSPPTKEKKRAEKNRQKRCPAFVTATLITPACAIPEKAFFHYNYIIIMGNHQGDTNNIKTIRYSTYFFIIVPCYYYSIPGYWYIIIIVNSGVVRTSLLYVAAAVKHKLRQATSMQEGVLIAQSETCEIQEEGRCNSVRKMELCLVEGVWIIGP